MFGSTSLDSLHHATLPTSSSTASLDVAQLLEAGGTQLFAHSVMSESLTMIASISLTSIEDAKPPPPFSSMVPLSRHLSLGSHLPMFPRGLSRMSDNISSESRVRTTLTGPTTPRLRTMLKENLDISKWAETLACAIDSPGHDPWGGIEDVSQTPWIPEGSIHSPEAFREALLKARRPRPVKPSRHGRVFSHTPSSPTSPKSPATSLKRHKSLQPTTGSARGHRNALVFEREITLHTDGRTKRWSVQAPAMKMNTELVEMMLELKGLNSFFKNGEEDANAQTAPPLIDHSLHPPSLMVSNSDFSLPISLESSGNIQAEDTPNADVPLSTRRGKKTLAPLLLPSQAANAPPDAYFPSIPSAFLGSPSSYQPQFEFANSSSEPSMDLHDMISDLRARCASIAESSPITGRKEEGAGGGRTLQDDEFQRKLAAAVATPSYSQIPSLIHEPQEDEDEWSFADHLIDKFDDPVETVSQPSLAVRKSRGIHLSSGSSLSSISASDSMLELSYVCVVGPPATAPGFITAAPFPPLKYAPPMITKSSPKLGYTPRAVQGILKASKNVRFAASTDEITNSFISEDIAEESRPPTPSPVTADRPRVRMVANAPIWRSATISHVFQGSQAAELVKAPASSISKTPASRSGIAPRHSTGRFHVLQRPSVLRRNSESTEQTRPLTAGPTIPVSTTPHHSRLTGGSANIATKTGTSNLIRLSQKPVTGTTSAVVALSVKPRGITSGRTMATRPASAPAPLSSNKAPFAHKKKPILPGSPLAQSFNRGSQDTVPKSVVRPSTRIGTFSPMRENKTTQDIRAAEASRVSTASSLKVVAGSGENAGRRNGVAEQRSRMPVPLRNIFTKLK